MFKSSGGGGATREPFQSRFYGQFRWSCVRSPLSPLFPRVRRGLLTCCFFVCDAWMILRLSAAVWNSLPYSQGERRPYFDNALYIIELLGLFKLLLSK
jgi:hypothetical protein